MLPSNSVCPVMLVIADSTWSLVDETTHGAEEKCWQSRLCTKFWNPENRCQEIHSLIWSVTYLKIGGLGRESPKSSTFQMNKKKFFIQVPEMAAMLSGTVSQGFSASGSYCW